MTPPPVSRPDEGHYDLTYLSLGAGVQSSALLVCSALGLHGVPKADVAIFADTQNEPPHVYEAVKRLTAWAAPRGIPVETVTAGNLLTQAIEKMRGQRKRYSSLPMWVRGADGKEAPMRRQCTRDFKIIPIQSRVRELLGYKPRQRVRKMALGMVGISLDEIERMKRSDVAWIVRAHPLIDARLTREACVRIVLEAGLPRPKKSACTFCPWRSDSEWLDLQKNAPASFEEACKADEALRDQRAAGLSEPAFVHRSLAPLRVIAPGLEDRVEARYGMPLFPDGGWGNDCDAVCGV